MTATFGDVRLNPNFERELARAHTLRPALEAKTKQIERIAVETAPVGDDDDPHAGRYKEGLESEVVVEKGREVGKVRATAPESRYVEFGTINNPAFHTLRNAADRAAR